MTPGPTLQELITTVRSDAASPDPLDQLATASRTVAELVDVGDAVLGHFVDQCRRSGRSWSEISGALGVTKQAAHKRFSIALAPTLERMTERARSALRAAVEDARSLGHNYVGTEHILLGLYEPARGLAAQILSEAGITRAEVEERILHVAPRGAGDRRRLGAAVHAPRGRLARASGSKRHCRSGTTTSARSTSCSRCSRTRRRWRRRC